jgi:DNA-directed RNA polymerase sigma subunit (sigma70/sigma32)
MTSPQPPDDRHEALFIADFYPALGAYLARQHERGYDAVAGRARFMFWLAEHTDGGALTDYLARAVRMARLTADEETGLATRIAAGRRAEEQLADALPGEAEASLRRIAEDGARAGHRLLEAHLWQVVSLAERFAGRGVPFPDLIQEGNLGLIRAIQQYDHTKGYRFATFAAWWIRQAITRAVTSRPAPAPTPEPGAGGIDELTLAERWMLQLLGREPTPEELAAELDLPSTATSWSPPSRDRDR